VSLGEHILRHVRRHGLAALFVSAWSLALLRGLDLRIVLLFGLPPVFAGLHTGSNSSRATRRVAWAFLVLVSLGYVVAHVPQLFPNLGGVERRLEPWQDRMLTWYVAVYLTWIFGVLPAHLFLGSLRAHRQGERAPFSRFTCRLGLFAAALCCLSLPGFLASLLGFWPLF
jgi:hypothetical protein